MGTEAIKGLRRLSKQRNWPRGYRNPQRRSRSQERRISVQLRPRWKTRCTDSGTRRETAWIRLWEEVMWTPPSWFYDSSENNSIATHTVSMDRKGSLPRKRPTRSVSSVDAFKGKQCIFAPVMSPGRGSSIQRGRVDGNGAAHGRQAERGLFKPEAASRERTADSPPQAPRTRAASSPWPWPWPGGVHVFPALPPGERRGFKARPASSSSSASLRGEVGSQAPARRAKSAGDPLRGLFAPSFPSRP